MNGDDKRRFCGHCQKFHLRRPTGLAALTHHGKRYAKPPLRHQFRYRASRRRSAVAQFFRSASNHNSMKRHSRNPVLWLLPVFAGVTRLATAADPEKGPLPKLDEHSAKGLQFHCSLVKTNFTVGEPVNVSCLVTNTTDSIKPIVWHPSTGSHYCLVKGETAWMGGVLPLVIPQLRDEIKIKSRDLSPEFLLFLPPHSSLHLLLTYKPERPERFKGRVVYDPMTHGGGFFGDEALEKAKQACVFSNTFEYEITDGEKK